MDPGGRGLTLCIQQSCLEITRITTELYKDMLRSLELSAIQKLNILANLAMKQEVDCGLAAFGNSPCSYIRMLKRRCKFNNKLLEEYNFIKRPCSGFDSDVSCNIY